MNFSQLKLIIKREYLNKVKNKVFIISTILGPLGLIAILGVQVIATAYTKPESLSIGIIDESKLILPKLPSKHENFSFMPLQGTVRQNLIQIQGKNSKLNGILYFPKDFSIKGGEVTYYGKTTLSVSNYDKLENLLVKILKDEQLIQGGIRPSQLDSIQAKISLTNLEVNEKGDIKPTHSAINMFIGFGTSMLLYMFLFIYGAIVLRIVIEEKTNRVVEVLLTCVKPIDLLISKIIAVLLVGLTQIAIWLFLMIVLLNALSPIVTNNKVSPKAAQVQMVKQDSLKVDIQPNKNSNLVQILYSTSYQVLVYFVLYFVGGYLFYGSLFAAIGSAVDNESDTQYLQLPITIPIIIPILFTGHILENPNSSLSKFLSYFPMTSPMTMLTRFSAGKVEAWELFLSLFVLYASVVGALWVAAKIYRTGILMYGKKPSYKELWKWLKMS
ncbi:MAG: ABC transporter permease [Bacteroidia bacterium]|nr:ABC transporter permease [Bacteroidia bacterium]